MEQATILSYFYGERPFYYFGFVPAGFLVLVVSSAAVSIAITDLHLSEGSHRWWWPSFLAPASSGVYLFAYCLCFAMDRWSRFPYEEYLGQRCLTLAYVGYCVIFSLAFAPATGCIGFLVSFIYVRKIYGVLEAHNRDRSRRDFVEHDVVEGQDVGVPKTRQRNGGI